MIKPFEFVTLLIYLTGFWNATFNVISYYKKFLEMETLWFACINELPEFNSLSMEVITFSIPNYFQLKN